MKQLLIQNLLTMLSVCTLLPGAISQTIEIDSLQALAKFAHDDNVSVKLKSGVYELNDPIMGQELDMTQSRYGWEGSNHLKVALLHFSGNDSTYDLTGATINLDTKLHAAFGKKELLEVFVTGDRNVIKGLTLRDVGSVVPTHTANMMCIVGNDNTIENADLYIHGSSPYGYGHLLGKGRGALVPMRKHCGVLIAGERTKFIGSTVKQYAFGHAIYMQGAVDTLIQDCYVEGEMRTTDEMLQEREGLAHKTGFKSHYPPGDIISGQIKSLAEDAIRTYPRGAFVAGRRTARVQVINCVMKNMRCGVCLGFEQGPSKIVGCTAIGYQERGYSIGTDGVIEDSKGDAMYGPLLTFLGPGAKNCVIDLKLMPGTSPFPVPRLLEINGTGHKIRLRNSGPNERSQLTPIVFGESDWGDIHLFRAPESSPNKYSGAYNCIVMNETAMPVIFSELSENCVVITDSEISEDRGFNNKARPIALQE